MACIFACSLGPLQLGTAERVNPCVANGRGEEVGSRPSRVVGPSWRDINLSWEEEVEAGLAAGLGKAAVARVAGQASWRTAVRTPVCRRWW